MAKLTEDMKQARVMANTNTNLAPLTYRVSYGQTCDICRERPIEGYIEVRFAGRVYSKGQSQTKATKQAILPGTTKSACLVCAATIYREYVEKIGRLDRVELADRWLEAARDGAQEDPA